MEQIRGDFSLNYLQYPYLKVSMPACWEVTLQSTNGYNFHFCNVISCCWVLYDITTDGNGHSPRNPVIIDHTDPISQTQCFRNGTNCFNYCNELLATPDPKISQNNNVDGSMIDYNYNSNIPISYEIIPNPTSDKNEIRYQAGCNGLSILYLYDINGNLIYSQKHVKKAENDSYILDVNGLSSGIYHFIIMINDAKIISANFIILK